MAITIEEMTLRFTDRQTKMVRELKTKRVSVFEYDGVLFKGDGFTAKMVFAWNNPEGGDFYVWLQQHYQMVTPTP